MERADARSWSLPLLDAGIWRRLRIVTFGLMLATLVVGSQARLRASALLSMAQNGAYIADSIDFDLSFADHFSVSVSSETTVCAETHSSFCSDASSACDDYCGAAGVEDFDCDDTNNPNACSAECQCNPREFCEWEDLWCCYNYPSIPGSRQALCDEWNITDSACCQMPEMCSESCDPPGR